MQNLVKFFLIYLHKNLKYVISRILGLIWIMETKIQFLISGNQNHLPVLLFFHVSLTYDCRIENSPVLSIIIFLLFHKLYFLFSSITPAVKYPSIPYGTYSEAKVNWSTNSFKQAA